MCINKKIKQTSLVLDVLCAQRVTQYNKVIGHGRARPTAEDEFIADNVDNEDDDALLEDVGGYRFGEGYRLALDDDVRDFSAAQEQDEEEVDEFKEPSAAAEDDDTSDGNAYSQAYVQF